MKTKLFLALLLAAVVTWGCGSSDKNSTPADAPTAIKTGTVTFSIKFPAAGAEKSFIDSKTAKVIITGDSYMSGWSMQTQVELTPSNPTATIEVPEGQICFNANAQDNTGMIFDRASTCGEVLSGIANKATLTFLGGDWVFVDANDNPTPLTLQGTAAAVNLAGFRLSGSNPYPGPARAAIDYSKPSGWAEYGIEYFSGTTTNPATFGPRLYAESESQFLPGATASTNYTAFWGDALNLDVPANSGDFDLLYAQVGERVVFFIDEASDQNGDSVVGSNGQSLIPTLQPFADSRVADASTLAGHILEMTIGATPSKTLKQANANCWDFYSNQGTAARAAALSKAMVTKAGVASKAAPGDAAVIDSGTMTVTFDDCEWDSASNSEAIYTYVESYSNVIAREFRAKAQQKGTIFATTTVTPGSFLEYRDYEDDSKDGYTGWVQYTNNGQPTSAADLSGIQILDPAGAQITPLSAPVFIQSNFLTAGWNGSTFNFAAAPSFYSGYRINLGSSLPAGSYTFRTTLATGSVIDTSRNVGTFVASPVVLSSSMQSSWNTPDGSLTLSWSEPAGSFESYRIILRKEAGPVPGNTTEIFYGKALPGTTSVTLSSTDLAAIRSNAGIPYAATLLYWEVQTRIFDANNFEIARGISNFIPVTQPVTGGPATAEIYIR